MRFDFVCLKFVFNSTFILQQTKFIKACLHEKTCLIAQNKYFSTSLFVFSRSFILFPAFSNVLNWSSMEDPAFTDSAFGKTCPSSQNYPYFFAFEFFLYDAFCRFNLIELELDDKNTHLQTPHFAKSRPPSRDHSYFSRICLPKKGNVSNEFQTSFKQG